MIVHVQDAHCNYPAQKAISGIIKYVSETYGISDVNLEGGAGEYNFGVFNVIADGSVKAKVADNFVKSGVVSGPEFFAITNPGKVDLWGIEDPSLYLKDLGIYRDSLSYKPRAIETIHELNSAVERLKAKLYSPALAEFDNFFAGYKSGKVDFNDYLVWLTDLASRTVIDYKQTYPNVYLIAQVLRVEKNIDFKKANSERESFISRLQELLSRKDMEELVGMTIQLKNGQISEKVFYEYLLVMSKLVDLKLDNFPDLQKYIIYISMYQACDKYKLMGEISSLETAIKETLFDNEDQRKISRISKNLVLMENIFNIGISRDDYEYFAGNRKEFAAGSILPVIKEELAAIGEQFKPKMDPLELDTYLDKIQGFFEFSFKRDDAFMNNLRFTKVSTPSGDVDIAMIVTGGFHAANMAELFRKKDIAYVSIMPKFTNNADYKSPYFSLLEGDLTGAEKAVYAALNGTASSKIQVATFFASNAEMQNAWGQEKELAIKATVCVMARVQAGKKVLLTSNERDRTLGSWGDGPEEKMTVSELVAEVKAAEETRAQSSMSRGVIDPGDFGSGDVLYEFVRVDRKDGEDIVIAEESDTVKFAEMMGQSMTANVNIALYTDQAGKLHVVFGRFNTPHKYLMQQVPGDSVKYAISGVMAGVVPYYGTSTVLTPEQTATRGLFKIEIDRHTDENKAFKDFVRVDEPKLGLIYTDPFTGKPYEYFAGKKGQHLLVIRALNNDYRDDILLLNQNKEPSGILKRINDELIENRRSPIYTVTGGTNKDGSANVEVSSQYASLFGKLQKSFAGSEAVFKYGETGLYNIILGKANGRTILTTQFANEDEYSLFGMAYPGSYAKLLAYAAQNNAEIVSKFYTENNKLEKMPVIDMLSPNTVIVNLNDSAKCSAKFRADLGNKGANLGEMTRINLPVPDGFVLTRNFYKTWKSFGKNADGTVTLKKALENPAFKMMFDKIIGTQIDALLKDGGEVSIRSSGVVSMPGMLETEFARREDFPSDGQMRQAIIDKIQFVLASWDADKARYYREMMRIPDELGTAVVIQKLVRGDKQTGAQLSASGVIYSRDPKTGRAEIAGGYKELTPGKDIVSGQVSTKDIQEMNEQNGLMYTVLWTYASLLESHFGFPQEIEFTIQDGKPFILQTRDFRPSPRALEFYLKNENKLTPDAAKKAKKLIKTYEITHLLNPNTDDLLALGKPSTAGAAAGVIVFVNEDGSHLESVKRYKEAGKEVILVTDVAPENTRLIEGASGVIALKGDTTSHAAVLMRANNVPAIVGVSEHMEKEKVGVSIATNAAGRKVLKIGTMEYPEGREMSMDGETGEVYENIQTIVKEDLDVQGMTQRINDALRPETVIAAAAAAEQADDTEVVEVMYPSAKALKTGQVKEYNPASSDPFIKGIKASLIYYARMNAFGKFVMNDSNVIVSVGTALHREMESRLGGGKPTTMGLFNFQDNKLEFRPYSKDDSVKPNEAAIQAHINSARKLCQHLWNDPELREILSSRGFRVRINKMNAEPLFNFTSLVNAGLISPTSDNTPYSGQTVAAVRAGRSSGAIADGARADGKKWEDLVQTAQDPEKELGLSPQKATPQVLSQIREALRHIVAKVPLYYGPEYEANSAIINEVKAEASRLLLKLKLPEDLSKNKIFLFNSQVRGKEDYLLGFRLTNGYLGLSVDVIDALYNGDIQILSEYLFHELAEQMDIEHDVLYGKTVKDASGSILVTAEKARERSVQGNLYGKTNPLQPALRRFIDAEAAKQSRVSAPDKELAQHVESALKRNDDLLVFGKKDGSVIVVAATSSVGGSLSKDPNVIASGRILPASQRIEFYGRPGQSNLLRGINSVIRVFQRARLTVPGMLGDFGLFVQGINSVALSSFQPLALGAIADGTNAKGEYWDDLLQKVGEQQSVSKDMVDPAPLLGVERVKIPTEKTLNKLKQALNDIVNRKADLSDLSEEDAQFLQAIKQEAKRINTLLYGWGDLASSRLYLFNSNVVNQDNYLLGFGIENGYIGLSQDVIDYLYSDQAFSDAAADPADQSVYVQVLSEYVFHELAESLNKSAQSHQDLYGKFDRANSIQGRMYGATNPLKASLRAIVDKKTAAQQARPLSEVVEDKRLREQIDSSIASKGKLMFFVSKDGKLLLLPVSAESMVETAAMDKNLRAAGTINPFSRRIEFERGTKPADAALGFRTLLGKLRANRLTGDNKLGTFAVDLPGNPTNALHGFDAVAFGAIADGANEKGEQWESLLDRIAQEQRGKTELVDPSKTLGIERIKVTDDVTLDRIKAALNTIITREADIEANDVTFLEEIKREAQNIKTFLDKRGDIAESRIFLFNSKVSTPDDYLLGFGIENGYIGLSKDVMDRIYVPSYPDLLAEYIFHELAESLNKGMADHHDLYGKFDRANSLQGRMFGAKNPLKISLRGFINDSVRQKTGAARTDPATQFLATSLANLAPEGAFVKFVISRDGSISIAVGDTSFNDLELRKGRNNVLAEGTINFSPSAKRINLIRYESPASKDRLVAQRALMQSVPIVMDQLGKVDATAKKPLFKGRGFYVEFPYITPQGRQSSAHFRFDNYSSVAFGAIASGNRPADGVSWEKLIEAAVSPEDLGVERVSADDLLFARIKYALNDILQRKPDPNLQTKDYAEAFERIRAEARKLLDSLRSPESLGSADSLIYLFNSVVTGREDYLLGFRLKSGITGLAADLIQTLYQRDPVMLSEYIFHELAESLNIEAYFIDNTVYQDKHGLLYGKGNRALSPQGAMYDPAYNGITGADGTPLENPLKGVLREFIDLQAEAANLEFIPVASEEVTAPRKAAGGKPSVDTVSAGRFADRVKYGARSGQEFYFTIIPIPGEPDSYRMLTDTSISRLNRDSGGSENVVIYGYVSTADKKVTVIKNRGSEDERSIASAEKGYELLSGMGLPELKDYSVTVPGRSSFPFVLKYGESIAKVAAERAAVNDEEVKVFDLTAELEALAKKPEVAAISAGFPKDVNGAVEGDKPWSELIAEAKTPYDLGIRPSSVDDATFNAFKASLGDIVARIDRYSGFQKGKFSSMNAVQRARVQAELAALDKVKERCRMLQPKLISPFSFMDKNLKIFAFDARIDGPEDYLLGFELGDGTTGISFGLIEYLLRAERKIAKERGIKVSLISEYIFHEFSEKTLGKDHRELYGKYNRTSSLQGMMYGEPNYLGPAIRQYIDKSHAARDTVQLIKVENAVAGGGSSIRGFSGSSGDLASALIAAKGNRADVELVILLSGGKPVVALNSAANRFSRTDVLGYAKISGTENTIRFTPVKTDPSMGADIYRKTRSVNNQKLMQAVNIAVPQLRAIRNYDISKYLIEAQGLGIGGQLVGNYQGMRAGGMIASGTRAADLKPWSEVISGIVDKDTLESAGIPRQRVSDDTITTKLILALDSIIDRPNLASDPADKQAIDAVKTAAAKLRDSLGDTASDKWQANLYLFNSDISGEEDYLLGFGVRNDATGLDVIGIASDLVDFLYDEKNISLLSEYIFHELAEHLDRDHGDIYGKEDRAKSLQGIVYGPDNMLKYSLRNFIDMKAIGKKAEIEAVPARSADKDSTVERAAVAVDESAAIRLKTVDVKVVVGNVSDPSTQSGMNNSVRNFNTNVKLKFGKDGDNQQLRTFKITLDVDGRMNADETIKSFSREIEKGLAGLKDSGRLVAYMPILDKSDIARMNSETDLSAEDLLLNILTERNDPNLETIKQAITDKKLVLLKDAYTDCFRAGTTALPDVAWRFVYARQYVNLFNTENALGKKDTMLALLNLLKKVSGEDFNYPTEAELAGFMKEITDSGKTGKFFDFMSRTVIKIRPINYGEIQEYQQMMDKVAVSL